MKKPQFVITDSWAKTGLRFIDKNGNHVALIHDALKFDSKAEAREHIKNCNWGKWAKIEPFNQ